MKAAGLKIPLMGGDGVQSDDYIKIGGAATEGDYVTALGAPTESLDSAKQFLTDYAAEKYDVPVGPYGGYGFDSANAIINALAKAVGEGKSGKDLRAGVVKELGEISFEGITGTISFDQFGDTNSKVLTVYEVKGGKFVASKTDSFK